MEQADQCVPKSQVPSVVEKAGRALIETGVVEASDLFSKWVRLHTFRVKLASSAY